MNLDLIFFHNVVNRFPFIFIHFRLYDPHAFVKGQFVNVIGSDTSSFLFFDIGNVFGVGEILAFSQWTFPNKLQFRNMGLIVKK